MKNLNWLLANFRLSESLGRGKALAVQGIYEEPQRLQNGRILILLAHILLTQQLLIFLPRVMLSLEKSHK